MPCLCIIEKLLKLKVSEGGLLLMGQVYESLGDMGSCTRCHAYLLAVRTKDSMYLA
jgi:hypothetical protein